MVNPTPGATLQDEKVTFSWAANGVPVTEWWLYVGTSLGGKDLHDSGSLGTRLSTTVAGLPTNGSPVWVRLWYQLSGDWLSIDYQYSAPKEGPPQMVNPTPGATLQDEKVTFSWAANGVPVTEWWLYVGTSLGGKDLHDSRSLGTRLSTTVAGLPTNGSPVWVRLWYQLSGDWLSVDYQYSAGGEDTPQMVNPTPGATLQDEKVTFSWAANGAPVTEWWLYVGTSLGGKDLHDSRSLGTRLSTTVAGLPTNGSPVWVRLWYQLSGDWLSVDYQYSAPTEGPPQMVNPTPGATLQDEKVTFSWAANGVPVTEWWLYVGTSFGGKDLHDSRSLGTRLSTTVAGLPTNGSPVWVRLWYQLSGDWLSVDYQYSAG